MTHDSFHDHRDLLEEVERCAYCRSERKRPILARNGLRIVKCLDCGLAYTDRRWNRRGAELYYQEGYFTGQVPGAYASYTSEKTEKLIDFDYKYRHLKRFASGGRLLDVGCATGFSLLAARSHGYEPEGIDLSQWAVGKNETELTIRRQDLTEMDGEGQYDSISMWDVIEHFLDPETCFAKLNELLRPGGRLILTYPDPTSWMARLLGRRWPVFVPEEHTFFYPRRLLAKWLRRFGFERLHECHEKRYFTVSKLAQKILPAAEGPLHRLGLGGRIVSCRIPYKRMAVYAKVN